MREDTIVRVRSARTRVEGEGQPRELRGEATIESETPGRLIREQSHASTRWCHARDTDERRMMRRATYPKRRSKRCAREGTPRAVSFRECGDRGWRVGFSTDRFRRRGLVLQKNVILTKTPYVACIGNTVEKDGQMTQTPEDFGAHFRRDDGNFSCFCFSHPLDSSSSARAPLVAALIRARGHASGTRPASRRADAARGGRGDSFEEIEGEGEGRGRARRHRSDIRSR